MKEHYTLECAPRSRTTALDSNIFRLRRGCHWNRLPQKIPDDSFVLRTFVRGKAAGVFVRISATRCREWVLSRPTFSLAYRARRSSSWANRLHCGASCGGP